MRRISTLLAVALMFGLAACGSSAKTSSPSSSTQAGGSINVLAASSLTKGFTALGEQFEAAHPGSHVNFSFASSSTLAEQIQNGAPADVFASADQKNMTRQMSSGMTLQAISNVWLVCTGVGRRPGLRRYFSAR